MAREKSKKIFIGVDMGKEINYISIVFLGEGTPRYQFEIKNTYHGFNEMKSYIDEAIASDGLTYNECILGLESTGNYGVNIAKYIEKLGVDVVQVPSVTVKRMKDVYKDVKNKHDKGDARIISYCLRDNHYVVIKKSDTLLKDLKKLTRSLNTYRVSLAQVTNRMHSWLEVGNQVFKVIEWDFPSTTGINLLKVYPCVHEVKYLSVSEVYGKLREYTKLPNRRKIALYLQEAEVAREYCEPLTDLKKDEIKNLIEEYEFLEKVIKNLEIRIKKLALEIEPNIEKYLDGKIDGMSDSTFISLLAETNFMKDFKSARSLLNFCGLTVIAESSGGMKKKPGISKSGSRHARKHAYVLTDVFIKHNKDIRRLYCYYKTYERENSVSKKAMFLATISKVIRGFYGAIKSNSEFNTKELLKDIDFDKCNKKKFREEMKPLSKRKYNK